MAAQPGPSLRPERQRRHVGLWIHARTAGQRAHRPGRTVERCPFADGDVPYLARQTVVREQRAVSDRFEREGGLPIRSQAEHEGIVLCKRKRRANPVNLGFRDAVGRKFVAVEDTAYAGEFRGSCELSSEPRQLSTFLIERFGAKQAGQSRK